MGENWVNPVENAGIAAFAIQDERAPTEVIYREYTYGRRRFILIQMSSLALSTGNEVFVFRKSTNQRNCLFDKSSWSAHTSTCP